MVGSRVYVGGLPYGVRERDLERFFKGYGRTRDILIKNGYGFVVSSQNKEKKVEQPKIDKSIINSICRNLRTIVMQTMPYTN